MSLVLALAIVSRSLNAVPTENDNEIKQAVKNRIEPES